MAASPQAGAYSTTCSEDGFYIGPEVQYFGADGNRRLSPRRASDRAESGKLRMVRGCRLGAQTRRTDEPLCPAQHDGSAAPTLGVAEEGADHAFLSRDRDSRNAAPRSAPRPKRGAFPNLCRRMHWHNRPRSAAQPRLTVATTLQEPSLHLASALGSPRRHYGNRRPRRRRRRSRSPKRRPHARSAQSTCKRAVVAAAKQPRPSAGTSRCIDLASSKFYPNLGRAGCGETRGCNK